MILLLLLLLRITSWRFCFLFLFLSFHLLINLYRQVFTILYTIFMVKQQKINNYLLDRPNFIDDISYLDWWILSTHSKCMNLRKKTHYKWKLEVMWSKKIIKCTHHKNMLFLASCGNWTHDPRITSAMPYHLAKQALKISTKFKFMVLYILVTLSFKEIKSLYGCYCRYRSMNIIYDGVF